MQTRMPDRKKPSACNSGKWATGNYSKILNSLDEDSVRTMKKQLLSIAEDGEITEDEQEEFDGIVKKLEVLATAISELRMLAEKYQNR